MTATEKGTESERAREGEICAKVDNLTTSHVHDTCAYT